MKTLTSNSWLWWKFKELVDFQCAYYPHQGNELPRLQYQWSKRLIRFAAVKEN